MSMISPIQIPSVALPTEGLSQPAVPAGQGGFARVMEQFLNSAGAQNTKANQAIYDLATGRADNLHNVLLDVAKADLTFRLILEIRNRLTNAYQQIMQMQV
jgi:flagellar hook-basal body complex protein FliE